MDTAEHMSREERIQRIGELLSKGVTLMLMREAEQKRANQAAQAATVSAGSDGAEVEAPDSCKGPVAGNGTARSILDYLKRVGQASPRDIQRSLALPRTTLYRHLNQLIQARLVVGAGKTSAIRYRVSDTLVVRDGSSGTRFADQMREDSAAECT